MSTQRDFIIEIPAISTEIFLAEMDGVDEISACFAYSVLIGCDDMNLDPELILGTKATVTVRQSLLDPRVMHGYIADMAYEELRDDAVCYRLTLRPWLWFLSLDTDNRIFQNKTSPEIIEEVLKAWPDAKFNLKLTGSYQKREYCVQYGESDLDFIQRLMEDEGIFYWFLHEPEGHTMVLVDSNSGLLPEDAAPVAIPYEPDSRVSFKEGDFITHWVPKSRVRSGHYYQTDYDFKKPNMDLASLSSAPLKNEQAKGEVYTYPGKYVELSHGSVIAERRLQELQSNQLRIAAKGTAQPLMSGVVFELTKFPRQVENDKYIVVRARYRVWGEQRRGGQDQAASGYLVETELTPYRVTFRPPRRTPWPRMKGPQTAVVVGPAGAEIFTDEFSRVKVQFHWDRLGQRNENTTCFIRVSSTWAGAGWGFIQIPRIGHEVIVDFLEGDPDQPIITGRVYNAMNVVPYGLPGNASQSGWKSWSTPETGGFNELRFEDKAGSEQVYFQAEKDHLELVKNDETRTIGHDWVEDVGHDATQSVGHDRTESVANNKDVSVGNNRTVQIGVNDTETVGSNRSLTVGSNETISIGANSTETIGANHVQTVAIGQVITVGGARADTVGATEVRSVGSSQTNTIGSDRAMVVGAKQNHTIGSDDGWTVGGSQSIKIAKDQTLDVAGLQSIKIAKDQSTQIGGGQTTKVAKDCAFDVAGNAGTKAGKSMTLEAADSIIIKTGSAAISMKKDGTISIEGKDITLNGSGKINVKASGNVIVKGSKILNN